MRIGPAGLAKLAEMICGDAPFTYFPYRSSSYLSRFFQDLDLDYTHDGSTRRHWVRSVLDELNKRPSSKEDTPPPEMIKVIEYLLHPDHFTGYEGGDQEKALAAVKESLKTYGLRVFLNSRTKVACLSSRTRRDSPHSRRVWNPC